MTLSIDLGSGPVPKNPFGADEVYGVDIAADAFRVNWPNVKQADLAADSIPFNDNSADFVVCTDFLEHVPRTGYRYTRRVDGGNHYIESPWLKPYNPFLLVMSEVYRVLKTGGIFQAKTPAYPHPQAFQDPTHVNVITDQTVQYFIKGGMLELGQAYGFKGEFELLEQYWDQEVPYWLVWELQKP